jgi:hypothetical protein
LATDKNNKIASFESLANADLDYENVKENTYIIYNNYNNLDDNVLDSKNVNLTYKDYVKYLSNSVDLRGANYVMIIERCEAYDKDTCKYAYLEVYDEA